MVKPEDLPRGVWLKRVLPDALAKKRESARAEGEDPRTHAMGFLVLLCQHGLASASYAMRCSLGNPAQHLEERLERVQGRKGVAQSPSAVYASSSVNQRTA